MTTPKTSMLVALVFGACTVPTDPAGFNGSNLGDGGAVGDGGGEVSLPVWDEPAAPIDCIDPETADLLTAVLDDARMPFVDLGWSTSEWKEAEGTGDLDDNFLRDGYREELSAVASLPCTGSQHAAGLDYALTTPHPLATVIGEAMDVFSINRKLQPIQPDEAEVQTLATLTGLDDDLSAALQPVLAALDKAAYTRTSVAAAAPERSYLLVESFGYLDLSVGPNQRWAVESSGPRSLWDRARALAYAIEDAHLDRFVDTDGSLDLNTPIGRIVVTDSGDDEWPDLGEVALWIDLGGDDVYEHAAAVSNDDVPVAVHIDLGGNDTYMGANGVASGRFGIGMLFDLSGDDTYVSSGYAQGWGHLGVGALVDMAGNDTYVVTALSQGASAMGLGILLDGAGNDVYSTYSMSQGFSVYSGMGIALDGDGDDFWFANPGTIIDGGDVLYPTCDDPALDAFCLGTPAINESLSQGVSMGYGGMSGGVGILRDSRGDDQYIASDRAQGYGYWQAAGFLLDGAGSDTYDLAAFGQGAGTALGTGVMLDAGEGDDVFGSQLPIYALVQGASSYFGAGVFVNEAGDDTYNWPVCSAGWSSCAGVGMFVDNSGADTYELSEGDSGGANIGSCGTGSVGFAETSCSYETTTAALFMDAGGDVDVYGGDLEDRQAGDDKAFGDSTGLWAEKGGAVDGSGESGLHAVGG